MFGIKKQNKRGLVSEKKKWQIEQEEEKVQEKKIQQQEKKQKEELVIDDVQGNQEDSEDSEEIRQQQEKLIEEQEKQQQEKQEELEKREKKYDWMDSEDDDISVSSETDPIEKQLREEEMARLAKENENNKIPDVLEDKDKRTIFVNNLNFELQDNEIEVFFKKFGKILSIEVPRNEGNLYNKGRAFVEYVTSNAAQKAIIQANGKELKHRPLDITLGLTKVTMQNANSKYSQKKSYYDSKYHKYQKSKSRSRSRERQSKKKSSRR